MATLTTCTTAVRQRADRESDLNVTDAEIQENLVRAYREGWSLMLRASRQYAVKAKTAFALTAAANTYDLAANVADFLEAVKLERDDQGDGTYSKDVWPYDLMERNTLTEVKFTVYENTLRVEPAVDAAGTYRLWYVAKVTDPTTTIVDPTGLLEQFIIDSAAAHCILKNQESTAEVARLKAELGQSLMAMSGGRMHPRRTVNVNGGRTFGFMRRGNW